MGTSSLAKERPKLQNPPSPNVGSLYGKTILLLLKMLQEDATPTLTMRGSQVICKFITFLEHIREPRLSGNQGNSVLKGNKSVEGKWVMRAVSPQATHAGGRGATTKGGWKKTVKM